ncbi:hypothetical protein [Streptomyces sp. NPDC051636]|uniref:hypothetical protein n=1 Tax=Streptomyces sp. NPDC051636 TaxID=3365663 RepID=UPI0037890415
MNGGTTVYGSLAAEHSTMSFRGASHTMHTEVVRNADVIGVYCSVNGIAIAKATPSDAQLPEVVVTAQSAKLG